MDAIFTLLILFIPVASVVAIMSAIAEAIEYLQSEDV